ncbi:MAG TPA: hypothetical protein VJU84_20615 [Pyrinomonadaceae bacterium]|nr:hypothetical protein [Pyrinomonadaceae bacterium]
MFDIKVSEVESPDDVTLFLAGYAGDLTALWEKLGIKTINVHEQQQLDPRNFRFLTECFNCETQEFHHDLDGEPGLEVIIRVQDRNMEATRYLIFKKLDDPVGKWKLLGHLDEMLNKYRSAQHAVVTSGGRSLLIITGQGASGSGVASYGSRLVLVKPDGMQDILFYPSDGQQAGHFDDPTLTFSASLLSCEIEGNLATVQIQFSAKYFISDPSREHAGLHLLTKTQRAVFTRWLGNDGNQILDETRSEISERELDDVFWIDSLTNEEFLIHNYDALAGIATGPGSAKKDWLGRFLKTCEPTGERKRLQELLQNSTLPHHLQ